MTKHTPGPWKTSAMAPGIVYREADGKRDELVCTAYRRNDDEHNANARLIASAPDLLVTLRELLADCTDTDGGLLRPTHYVVDRARAAIAKAEGRG